MAVNYAKQVKFGAEVEFSGWSGKSTEAAVRVYKIGTDTAGELADRMCMVLSTGAARVQFNPTAAEARDLIAALQWALEPVVAEAA